MSLVESIAIVLGLVVNATVLKTMSVLWRKRFLFIGIITSVFLVRFLLPLAIVGISVPNISLQEMFLAFSGQSDVAARAIEIQKPVILAFGGVFLLFLYLHWLFLEKKEPLFIERFLKEKHGVWFFAIASVLLVLIMYLARANSTMMLAAAIGSATFFIVYGLKETAEKNEAHLLAGGNGLSNLSKFVYLEVLDTTFSFDGVVGAFAFTINLLLILIGLGIGAIVVRELTIKGIDSISKYKYLKNGALTSIGFLGIFMLIESFTIELPAYIPTIITFLVIGVAFYQSNRVLPKSEQQKPQKNLPLHKWTQKIRSKLYK